MSETQKMDIYYSYNAKKYIFLENKNRSRYKILDESTASYPMMDLFYMTTKSKMLFMVTSSVSLSADRFILHDNEKQNVVQGDIICVSVS